MNNSSESQQDMILSVAEFLEALNASLKGVKAKIVGEVINVKLAASGHVYFTLKDKKENAVIDCIMWKYNYLTNGLRIENGLEILLTGNPNVYAAQGRLSFIAQTAEHVGEGALQKAYLELKQKLTSEGLLDESRKRILPSYPKRIGIITSKQGAVIHDFENNLEKRGYKLKLLDTRVEGKEALFDVLKSLKHMAQEDIDLLVIMRGGGSFQALATFDNETVVRAIASFPVPVIAAIGHHQDVPLAALVADSAVSTPTAAANLLDKSWSTAETKLTRDTQHILNAYRELLHNAALTLQVRQDTIQDKFGRILVIFHDSHSQLKQYLQRLHETIHYQNSNLVEKQALITSSFKKSIEDKRTILTNQQLDLNKSFTQALQQFSTQFSHTDQVIALHNPLRILKHGYSVIRKAGKVVKQTKDVTIGDSLELLVIDGTVLSTVTKTTTNKK